MEQIGAITPRLREGFAAVFETGLYLADAEPGNWRRLSSPELHVPGNRFNDAKCDPMGRLWAGTMDNDEKKVSGSLYRFDSLGKATRMRGDVYLSNGLGWSPDSRTFYFTDTLRRVIYAFDFDIDDGSLFHERVFAVVPEDTGYPDGLAVDTDGCIWSAHWNGARLTRYAPDGRALTTLKLPVPKPTSCAFGGTHLSKLFITSATVGLTERELAEAPASGSLFVADVAAAGVPVMAFAG